MGKYRRYKNRVEMYLASEKGKRVLNFCYSWGASIVIIGALFKLLHLPYGNQILFVAMTVEALVFFVSAFERPGNEYHWEEVFPVLKSKNPLDRPDFANTSMSNLVNQSENMIEDEANASGVNIHIGGKSVSSLGNLDVDADDTKTLSESIKKLSGAADQISKMAELTEATQKYLEQLSSMSEHMERFSQVTNSLTNVSDTLLHSYKAITDNSDGINQNSRGYVQQMEMLNRNISGLNTIYEIQLKSMPKPSLSLLRYIRRWRLLRKGSRVLYVSLRRRQSRGLASSVGKPRRRLPSTKERCRADTSFQSRHPRGRSHGLNLRPSRKAFRFG